MTSIKDDVKKMINKNILYCIIVLGLINIILSVLYTLFWDNHYFNRLLWDNELLTYVASNIPHILLFLSILMILIFFIRSVTIVFKQRKNNNFNVSGELFLNIIIFLFLILFQFTVFIWLALSQYSV